MFTTRFSTFAAAGIAAAAIGFGAFAAAGTASAAVFPSGPNAGNHIPIPPGGLQLPPPPPPPSHLVLPHLPHTLPTNKTGGGWK
jgi:uncharacterized RDD family membrane protein YckC